MTLIVGVKLPNGILIVSDTRTTTLGDNNLISDFSRKITQITNNAFLATAGTESTFLAARILRTFLFNAKPNTYNLTDIILELYRSINNLNMGVNHYPIGPIMLAEYNELNNEFSLQTVDPNENNFEQFILYNDIGNVAAIGANPVIRHNACIWIGQLLEKYGDQLDHPQVYESVAKNIQKVVFHYFENPTISKNVYVTYLSQINNKPASATFFLDENGKLLKPKPEDDTDQIKFQENEE